MDDDLVEFLTQLRAEQHLNRSILVLFSDHGHRFSSNRETLQGKLEERLPFLAIALPEWFRTGEPFAAMWRTLKHNAAHALTTPFDIHQTLRHILAMADKPAQSKSFPVLEHFLQFREVGKFGQGTSLFRAIPPTRSCDAADVPPHFCPCLSWMPVNLSRINAGLRTLFENAAEVIVQGINNLTEPAREKCAPLIVSAILQAFVSHHSSAFLQHWRDKAGVSFFNLNMKDISKLGLQVPEIPLQLLLETHPGQAHFDVHVTYSLVKQEFTFNWQHFSRTNKYGNQPACIALQLPILRPFCYCNDLKKQ